VATGLRGPAPVPASGTFLSRLPGPLRQELLALGSERSYEHGEHIIVHGARDRHAVLLCSGRAKVIATTPGGRTCLLGIRQPGDIVGELSIVDGRPRSAAVVAAGDVVGRTVPGSVFVEFLDRHPRAAREVMRVIGERLRSADRRRMEFAYNVPTRVACLLAEWVDARPGDRRSDIEVWLTQREIAELVGAAEVTVQKAMRLLARAGLLTTTYGRVVVRSPARLATEAQRISETRHST
jgi:CRP/FNR family transcriptional regulator, cyclic AMP receptor protein